jgi:hypothetical protein
MLEKAWNGINTAIFAYGSINSGKTYTIFGDIMNPGIAFNLAYSVFEKQNPDPFSTIVINLSMVEVYMDKVQDLLMSKNLRPDKGLPIREMGGQILVEGVFKKQVENSEEFIDCIEFGCSQRSMIETKQNKQSSRSHLICIVEFEKTTILEGKRSKRITTMTLVDLAGSNHIPGDRNTEGNQIILSLSVFNNVISTLASNATRLTQVIIPYRESILTRILQEALGGNASTAIIFTIKPGASDYEETVNTLQLAEKARFIRN